MDDRRTLERIETKIDAINEKLDTQSNRITALETQGGMIKLGMSFLIPIVGIIATYLLK